MAEDEIDLRKTLKSVIHHFKTKWILFTGLLVVFTVGGFVLSTQITQRYETSMLLGTQHVGGATINRILNQFNDMIDAGDFEALSKTLNIEVNAAGQLISFEASQEIDANSEEKKPIEINVLFKDPSIISELNRALPNYLEHMPYIQNRVSTSKEAQERAVSGLKKDIVMLDSAKNLLIFDKSELTKSIEVLESGSLFEASSNTYVFLFEVEKELLRTDHFSVITPFYQTRIPVFPKKSIFTAVGFVLGLVVCFLLLIGFELKAYINNGG